MRVLVPFGIIFVLILASLPSYFALLDTVERLSSLVEPVGDFDSNSRFDIDTVIRTRVVLI